MMIGSLLLEEPPKRLEIPNASFGIRRAKSERLAGCCSSCECVLHPTRRYCKSKLDAD